MRLNLFWIFLSLPMNGKKRSKRCSAYSSKQSVLFSSFGRFKVNKELRSLDACWCLLSISWSVSYLSQTRNCTCSFSKLWSWRHLSQHLPLNGPQQIILLFRWSSALTPSSPTAAWRPSPAATLSHWLPNTTRCRWSSAPRCTSLRPFITRQLLIR